jgi:hypothetical protein
MFFFKVIHNELPVLKPQLDQVGGTSLMHGS